MYILVKVLQRGKNKGEKKDQEGKGEWKRREMGREGAVLITNWLIRFQRLSHLIAS